jgi:predicted TIM-barrel fold metal-dependent hydrolase
MALKFREATNHSSGTSHDDACDALCGCAPRGQPLSRRSFLCSAAAAGLGSALSASPAQAQVADVKMGAGTIDVHHHYFPPATQEATFKMLTGVFGDVPERIRNWSPARAVEELDRNGVAKAIISTSARPRVDNLTPEQIRAQARASNQYGARMVQDYPERFAQFGFLPMPDVEATLQEIEYVFDVLKAPGVGMMTSYGDLWQGNPVFDPVLQELDRRKAVIFCHPLPAQCCTALMPRVAPREALFLEFPYDTGRAVVSLLMSGSLVKYRDIRWIFCHCGGPVPALAGRIRNAMSEMSPEVVARMAPDGLDYELRRQYYDTADAAYGPTMAAIMNYIPTSQILFGTDYPFLRVQTNAKEITDRGLSAEDMLALQRGNVTALMPQLAN